MAKRDSPSSEERKNLARKQKKHKEKENMRSVRFLLAFGLMLLPAVAFAQSDMHKSDVVQKSSDAQKSFDQLKTLAGTWRGSVKATPPDPDIDNAKPEITLRVTSRGNALVHEMQEAGT